MRDASDAQVSFGLVLEMRTEDQPLIGFMIGQNTDKLLQHSVLMSVCESFIQR